MNQPAFTNELDKIRWVRMQEVERKTQEIIERGYEFSYNGEVYVYETSDKGLFNLTIAYNIAKKKAASSEPYVQKMVMKDYKVITMDRDMIINTYDDMITYGLGIYNQHAAIIESLAKLSLDELRAWKDPRNKTEQQMDILSQPTQ